MFVIHDERFPNVKILQGAQIADEDVQIGQGTLIGHNVVIRPHVKIGINSVIAHNTIIESYCEIGNNTTIQVLNVIPSHTNIGNNVFIGPYFAIANCRHVPEGPKGTAPDKQTALLECLQIDDDVIIGTNCSCVPGIRIGGGSKVNMGVCIKESTEPNTHLR